MADTTQVSSPVDSRQAGFNPEVEASHAAANAALVLKAAAQVAEEVAPAAARLPIDVVVNLFDEIADILGAHPRLTGLVSELKGML